MYNGGTNMGVWGYRRNKQERRRGSFGGGEADLHLTQSVLKEFSKIVMQVKPPTLSHSIPKSFISKGRFCIYVAIIHFFVCSYDILCIFLSFTLISFVFFFISLSSQESPVLKSTCYQNFLDLFSCQFIFNFNLF